jgi:Domain of unknown function (DUF4062)
VTGLWRSSSTRGKGIDPYRTAAIEVTHRLGMTAVCMENFSPEGQPAVDVCRRMVVGCDLLVLLLGHRYGSRPVGHDASYTELEYEWAHAGGHIQVLPFVVDPDFPWPPGDIDRGADEASLNGFIETVKRQNTTRSFGDVNQFRFDLTVALLPFRAEPGRDKRKQAAGSARGPLPAPPLFHPLPRVKCGRPRTASSG